MNAYQLFFSPSPATRPICETCRGHVIRLTISHDQDTAQSVTFYDRSGVQMAQYLVHPNQSPYTIKFSNRSPFLFKDGLSVNTGNCVVNLLVIY
jgi:hypothetical protein